MSSTIHDTKKWKAQTLKFQSDTNVPKLVDKQSNFMAIKEHRHGWCCLNELCRIVIYCPSCNSHYESYISHMN